MNNRNEKCKMLNQEIMRCLPAVAYAKEHLEEIIEGAFQNCVRKVYSTGETEPVSLINHRVIGGYKLGRVLKSIPENGNYCETGYDSSGRPLYCKSVNIYKTEMTSFWFDFDGDTCIMTMELRTPTELYRKVRTPQITKYRFDEKGRVLFYANIDVPCFQPDDYSHFARAVANVYEYPDDAAQPIICYFYDYVTHLDENGNTKNPADTQYYETLYEITPDLKTITEYRHDAEGGWKFSRQLVSGARKSAKPKAAPDSTEKFAAWLDNELEQDIPESGGIYFDLFSPSEDGFGIYFSVTEDFDPDDDDWACNVTYCSDNMFMVNTNGAMEWEAAIKTAAKLIRGYLKAGQHRDVLRRYDGIGTAFSDGDIEYIRTKKS